MGVLSRLAILRMSLLCPSGMPVRWFSVRYLALVVEVKPEVKFQASHLLRMPSRFLDEVTDGKASWLTSVVFAVGMYTKRGPQVHGPPLWTWSMDHLCEPSPCTTPVDPVHRPPLWTRSIDHPCGPGFLTLCTPYYTESCPRNLWQRNLC